MTMTRLGVALALAVLAGACGAEIPMHSGYKTDKVKPWKKPKVIVLDENGDGKAEGDLSYREYRRARWYAVDLPADGELEVKMEASPPDFEEFDLAMEILDPNFIVISKADQEDEDAGELNKTRTVYDLGAGRYLIHVYLQDRMHTADFDLKVKYTAQARKIESDFPAQVKFPPRLAVVPLLDDTPAEYYKLAKRPVVKQGGKKRVKAAPPPDETRKIPARVINIAAQGSESLITVDRGTNQGVSDGMKGYVQGVKGGSFTVTSCSDRQCKGKVPATPDQISRSGKVIIIGTNP